MKLKKFITFTLASIMALSVPLTTMADDVDLSDIGVPVYERAQVQRKNVVINATPTDIPDELKDIVIRTYPEGKMKAFLLSFDDGGGNGATANDYHILVPLFTENNLNAAFNLNLRDDHKTQGPLLRIPESGKSVWGGGWTSQSFLDQVLPQYGGFEVSNHGLNHKTASNLSKDNLRREIGDCKNLLEDMFDKEVAGYAYAGGSNSPDSEPAPGAWRNAYLKYIGVRYARNAPTKNYIYADTAAKLYYTVPQNFYSWDPTIHITQPRPLGSGIAVSNLDIFNYYLNDLDASTDMKVFFGWGHSTDISSADYSNYTGVNPNGNYANVAEICRIAGENLDVLWNPTPLDYVDYINAMWNTTL